MVARKRQSTVSFRVQTVKVTLPAVPIGVTFKGTPPEITSVASDSPFAGKLSVGQVVEKVIIPKVIESECLDGADVEYLLSESNDTEGRILAIKTDNSEYTPVGRCSKVFVPKGDANDFGLKFYGRDPIIRRIDKDSPLAHRVLKGQLVYQFSRVLTTTGENQVVDIQNTRALRDVLKFTKEKRVRVILLQNIDIGAYRSLKRKLIVCKLVALVFIGTLVWYILNREGVVSSSDMV